MLDGHEAKKDWWQRFEAGIAGRALGEGLANVFKPIGRKKKLKYVMWQREEDLESTLLFHFRYYNVGL